MAVNKYMHPRNIYKSPPDFKQLALDYPEFRGFVKQDISGKVSVDFKDLKSLRALSCTLLKKDFGLKVSIPLNKLIPTIPLRLNYILWLEDLLSLTGKAENIIGIDIGTGASCIYPLLAAKKNKWSMVATEVDGDSISCARQNIEANALQNLIKIVKVEKDTLLHGVESDEQYDFCMCNPPFFASTQELHPGFNSRSLCRPKPKNSFCASVNEVVVKGGEMDFISKLINESKELGKRVQIYTTMMGHKRTLPQLKKLLREAQVTSFKDTEFCQGNTTRWGLAWTYCEQIDLKKCPDPVKHLEKRAKPKEPLTHELDFGEINEFTFNTANECLLNMFEKLRMSVEEVSRKKSVRRYFVSAFSNTWSNQRRKRREQLKKINDSLDSMGENNNEKDQFEENSKSPIRVEREDSAGKSPGKRTHEDNIEGVFLKKLKISGSESAVVFFKFIASVKLDTSITLELDSLDDYGNRDYLYQILQYIKNNLKSDMK
ncbi:hypothetical protein JTB14_023821 [Gonioctena quinquepunctata]|nr:hypothetical protein JTB14_023821 [Gonioctena quinquepunctata]